MLEAGAVSWMAPQLRTGTFAGLLVDDLVHLAPSSACTLLQMKPHIALNMPHNFLLCTRCCEGAGCVHSYGQSLTVRQIQVALS